MRAKRVMGKASFAKLEDGSGEIQLFLQQETLGDGYEDFKSWDVGDIIGAEGTCSAPGPASCRCGRAGCGC